MRPVRTLLTPLVLAAVLGGGAFLAGVRLEAERRAREDAALTRVLEAAREIRDRAPQGVSEEELAQAAIRGMLEVLGDPYASYLDPRETRRLLDLIDGTFVSVGLSVETVPRGLRVHRVLPQSPAAGAGVQVGDVILEADGQRLAGLAGAERFLAGEERSVALLALLRGERRIAVEVRRERIDLVTVESRTLAGGVAYARVSQFAKGTAEELREALAGLLSSGARALVLDLRGNGGGLAEEAVVTAGLFVQGRIVGRILEPDGSYRELYPRGDALPERPMAVLVDRGTASAAELVAGALHDWRRATLVGTRTFGKGSLLSVSALAGSDRALQFTTARFFTPFGRPVEGQGVVPDVRVLPGGPGDPQLARALAILEHA